MRQLNVIVHEEIIIENSFLTCDLGEKATTTLAEINSLRQTATTPPLELMGPAYELHPLMPQPTDDLEVIVSGGLKRACCITQVYTLLEAGYRAKLHPTACLDFGSLPKDTIARMISKYPSILN
ncbi:hypothetical protein HN587_04510 [Candidatus Woesearchaeota archaeon]|jgi:hypothetical protein|nr:hypothetical protein [Candidatus Woesearchaeota archaeon]